MECQEKVPEPKSREKESKSSKMLWKAAESGGGSMGGTGAAFKCKDK